MGRGLTRVLVLGSTGSIGTQTLDVIRSLPTHFQVVGLAAGGNLDLLAQQAQEFHPQLLWCERAAPAALADLASQIGAAVTPLEEMVSAIDLDVVAVGTAGRAGLEPTLTALQRGIAVALANKEVIVMAGHLVRRAIDEGGGQLRPVDSEHSAIWQCLWGEESNEIRRIILTASGGALRNLPASSLVHVTPEQALAHPTWKMGPKITVDSATLLNKGLETIEARWLFDVPYDRVEVVQHAESIVHSLVEFSDGSVKAQLGNPDMRLPIQCALSYPERLQPTVAPLDLPAIGTLTFETPDLDRYPCLRLAMEAGHRGGTYPTVLAAADEVAVDAFLKGTLRFTQIPAAIESALNAHTSTPDPILGEIDEADRWTRDFTTNWLAARF